MLKKSVRVLLIVGALLAACTIRINDTPAPGVDMTQLYGKWEYSVGGLFSMVTYEAEGMEILPDGLVLHFTRDESLYTYTGDIDTLRVDGTRLYFTTGRTVPGDSTTHIAVRLDVTVLTEEYMKLFYLDSNDPDGSGIFQEEYWRYDAAKN